MHTIAIGPSSVKLQNELALREIFSDFQVLTCLSIPQ